MRTGRHRRRAALLPAVNDYARPGQPNNEYFVWPASQTALAWELDQWSIFVEWNTRTRPAPQPLTATPATAASTAVTAN
ncbi:hypothetical protein WEI85_05785 [Actinomycetes bacterium KLBMP 9797]